MAPPRLAMHVVGRCLLVRLVSLCRMGPAEPAAPVVVTTAFPRRKYEVSLERQESFVGALVGLFQAQLEGVLVGVLVLQYQLADLLAMTFPLGFDILQSELDAIVNMRSKKTASLLGAMAQHCVNAVFWSVKLSQGLHATPTVDLQVWYLPITAVRTLTISGLFGDVDWDSQVCNCSNILRTMPSGTLDDAVSFCAVTSRGAHGSPLLILFVAGLDVTATVPAVGPIETKTSSTTL